MNNQDAPDVYCQTCGVQMLSSVTGCPRCNGGDARDERHSPIETFNQQNVVFATEVDPQTPSATVAPPVSAGAVPSQSFFSAIRDPVVGPRIMKAISVALMKSLGLTAIVMIPGLALLAVAPALGVLWLFVGSFVLLLRTYAKPWRLMWLTCLTPAIASGLCFLIQLAIFNDRIPPIALLLPAALLGMVIGLVRARSHLLYVENRTVMAKRTAGYLVIWAACYGFTQLLGMFAATMPLIRGGLLTSALSTGMLVCVSLVILVRYLKLRDQQSVVHEIAPVMAAPVAEVFR